MKLQNKKTITNILLALLLLSIIFISTLFSLTKIKTKLQADTVKSLQTIVQTTQEILEIWIRLRKIELTGTATHPEILELAKQLNKNHNDRKDIEQSEALKKLRFIMQKNLNRYSDNGFILINTNRINIASMRDENLNDLNLLYQQRQDFLDRVFAGETLFIPTTHSDVPLKTKNGQYREGLPTLFIATPIQDTSKNIIAVLAIRLDPSKDFTRIMQLGRLGDSGETYAFDSKATLISESRFDYQLQDVGLIQKNDQGILSIRITDPEINLLEGHSSLIPENKRKLTLMAKSALAKLTSHNSEGYRDYRGVPVIGAWTWNSELEIGITTEINLDEAILPYKQIRFAIISLTLLSISLCIGFIYFLRWRNRF